MSKRREDIGTTQEPLTPEEVTARAKERGACGLIEGCTSWRDLARVLKTPQGREFCMEHDWPSIEEWRGIKRGCPGLENLGIYVDCGAMKGRVGEFTLLAGETAADLIFGSNKGIQRVMAMHGARARVRLEGWAVAEIRADAKSRIEIEKTGKAIAL